MGAVTFSIDKNLIDTLLTNLPADIFVETGTFNGDTIDKIHSQFKEVYSVELSTEYYEKAKDKFKDFPHINLIHGNSADSIKTIMTKLKDQGVIFWLDAHWCVADNTAGQLSQCPLLKELESIEHLNQKSMIIIDDARLFLATPPSPHEVSDWPGFTDIIQILFKLSNRHRLVVLNDCILYFPDYMQKFIDQYAYSNGIDWLHVLDKGHEYDELLKQLFEKEKEIQLLAKQLIEKEKEIQLLAAACEERKKALEEISKRIKKKSLFF